MRLKNPPPLPSPSEKQWERFWKKIRVEPSGCWIWSGARGAYGGMWGIQHQTVSPHRLLWEQVNGPLHPEKSLRPTCGDVLCARPAHREMVSRNYPSHPRTDPVARFWAKVDKDGPAPHGNPAEAAEHGVCWVWTGSTSPKGYGSFNAGRDEQGQQRTRSVHRFAWEQENGAVPDGCEIDHYVCDRRNCVRPSHLRAVPHYDNVMRSPVHLWRRTHCNYGHPFSGDNLLIVSSGDGNGGVKRRCRTCDQRWRAKAQAK